MNFVNEEHRKRFLMLHDKCYERPTDKGFLAAIYLLSSPELAHRVTVSNYVLKTGHIRYPVLFQRFGPRIANARALLDLAVSCVNISRDVYVDDVFSQLNSEEIELAVEAIKIKYM